jgi:hypothetical protein
MNPSVPSPDPATYVAAVLILYVELPETPLRASAQDQWHARRLYDRGVPLRVVESAFLLASLRAWAAPQTVRHFRRFARWPVSNPSLTSCCLIHYPTITWTTCGSN